MALVLLATFLSQGFRWDADALSDLGVRDVAPLFNGAVLLGGLLTVPFAVGLREYLPRSRGANAGSIIVAIGGLSLAFVGIFTLATPGLHAAVALGYFVLVPVGLLVIGASQRATRPRWFAIGTGVAALFAILVLPVALLGQPVGFAVPEIIEALILAAWLVLTGAEMLRSSGMHSTPTTLGP